MEVKTITFEEFKSQFENLEHTNNIEWMSGGNNHQRDFYLFDGTQVIVNTCFPYSWLKPNYSYYWLDTLIKDNKENRALVKKYKGWINTAVTYTELQKVGIVQFDKQDDMLRYMYETDYKALIITEQPTEVV